MNFDKKYNMIGTICKSPNLDFIKNLKENMKDKCKVYVEIGVLYGGSMILMMDMPYECKHIGIDPFTGYYGQGYDPHRSISLCQNHFEIVGENLKNNNPMKQKWDLVRGNSNEVFDKITDTIDFLFIDGDHTYQGVKDDYNNYGCKVREGGYIVFDNYDDPSWYQVKQAVDELYDDKQYFKTVYGHCCVFEVLGKGSSQ